MLSDRDHELIFLAVDGELSDAEAVAFRVLLADSLAAQERYRTLLAHSRRVKSLTPVPAPGHVYDAVMAATGPRELPIIVAAPARSAPSRVAWWAAVAFVLAVGVGTVTLLPDNRREVAQNTKPGADPFVARVPAEVAAVPHAEPAGVVAVPPVVIEPVEVAREVAPLPRDALPPATTVEGAMSFTPRADFLSLDPRLPLVADHRTLATEAFQSRLQTLFEAEPVVRGLVATDDPEACFRRVRDALTKQGVTLFAPESPKKLGWVLYSEQMTPSERSELVRTLGDSPPVALAGHFYAANTADAREIREFTGVDRGFWKRPRARPAATPTADEVVQQLRKGARTALVLPLNAAGKVPPGSYPELKAFWQRAELQPLGAVLFVCRPKEL